MSTAGSRQPSPGRRLRDAWADGPVALPGVFNPLVARIAERVGFRAVYLSGGALSAGCGVPDVGLLGLTEFVDEARRIVQATTLPLVCDADTGFGEALNVERTVRQFEAAGAAGIHLDKDYQPFSLITSSSDLDTWSLTASHEELEMLVDPFGNRLVAGDSPKADQDRVEFLVEVADPSEDAEFAYTVNGILVSDFYTPRFFDPIVCSGVRYSFTGAITEPRQVLRGGYLSWHDPVSDDWWQEIWFSGSAPSFRNLGPLEAKGESLRSQIDRRTQSETAKALAKGRSVAAAAGLMAAASQQARTSKADHWHEQIGEILGRRDRATAAGKGRRAGATEQPRRSTTRSGIRSAGRVRPGD